MEKLSLKQAKRIVWLTWLEILVAGAIVVWATNPIKWYLLLLSLILIVDGLCRLFKKYKSFPKYRYSVIPSLFQPSAFFAFIIVALIFALYGEWNSWSWGLVTIGIAYFVATIPESRYWFKLSWGICRITVWQIFY